MTNHSNVMSKILGRVGNARYFSRMAAIDDLWKRNGLAKKTDRLDYKLTESKLVKQNGDEVTEYSLYKLVDSTVVTLSAEVTTVVEKRGKEPVKSVEDDLVREEGDGK